MIAGYPVMFANLNKQIDMSTKTYNPEITPRRAKQPPEQSPDGVKLGYVTQDKVGKWSTNTVPLCQRTSLRL